MRAFTDLFLALDATSRTRVKVAALAAYFRDAPALDAAWATHFLTGRKLKRLVRGVDLRAAAVDASGVPPWLFESSYEAVGDLAETIALLVPDAVAHQAHDRSLAYWVEHRIAPLAGLSPPEARAQLIDAWQQLDRHGRLVYGKLLTGAFRVGAGRELVHRALAIVADVPTGEVAQRLIGPWTPAPNFWAYLRGHDDDAAHLVLHRPYPFMLAHPLDAKLESLGAFQDWQVEWKWDGIRAQLLVRADGISLWSRGEALISDAFPEIVSAAAMLPRGLALDGELVAWLPGAERPAPFAVLQRRLGRRKPGVSVLRTAPVIMLVYDVLELAGADLRGVTLAERRATLETVVPTTGILQPSPVLSHAQWAALPALRLEARARGAEGLMLKRRESPYRSGRTRGDWWKWKLDPHTVDAVLMYAQAGSGRRASLYTDYTFGVWDGDALVAFAKAYSGLDDAEIRALDNWIRANTLERFGPVRSVAPVQVFELAFEGIAPSPRHRSGIAVRFPRIARWRRDKSPRDADTLATLRAVAAGDASARDP
ncbi:MAG: ATP-dependent DNA ligase [Casimicrobiaceae bacterium]